MLGGDTLIPTRFLTIISHLCVVATLIWQRKEVVRSCLPSQFHDDYLQIYHSQLVAGFASSITFCLMELIMFLSGLTMFHPTLSLLSIGCHGSATLALTYFVLGGWLCDWFWWIFATCDVLPCAVNLFVVFTVIMSMRYR